MINFMVFGLPRSGTNLVQYLLANKNYTLLNVNKLGHPRWKHSKPHMFPDAHITILVYKPLFCWLYSIRQYNGTTLKWFRKNVVDLHNIEEASDYYYQYYYNGIRQSSNIVYLNWISLLTGKELPLKWGFCDLNKISENKMGTQINVTKKKFNKDFYLNHEYLKTFSKSEYDYIESKYEGLATNGQLY